MANKRNPYFRFYPADFMGGVRGLSAQEIGLYTMLLCRMYEEDGPIEADAFRLATYCGMRLATFEKTLEKLVRLGKFRLENGTLTNARAMQEIQNRAHDVENAIRAGKVSAEKRQQNQSAEATTVQHAFNHTDTDTDTDTEYRDTNVSLARPKKPDELPDGFQEFWEQYPHRNGAKKGKAAAITAWRKAIKARASPQEIIGGAMRYATDRQVIEGYAKDPATWLNQKRWMDDVEPTHSNGQRPRSSGNSGMVDAFAAVAARAAAANSRGQGFGAGNDFTSEPDLDYGTGGGATGTLL